MINSVLVIDDDDVDQYIAKRALKKWGFEGHLFQERDGLNALEFLENYTNNADQWAEQFPPTLILLDINMPRLDGFEFLEKFEKLREQIEGLNSSIVMMFSSSQREEDKTRALSYDFVHDYITKPLTQENLTGILHSVRLKISG
ncbi:MAG: hypothetical protein COB37_11615 [Kordiimonadales bacterium]|nr:MAG: hypothetical protein COB37_11615 [Kordiimonadales bacterium]